MRRTSVTVVLALTLFCAGCQVSLFAIRGDEHVARGEFAEGIANYDAALIEARNVEARSQIEDKRRHAIELYIARALETEQPGNIAQLRYLASIIAAKSFGHSKANTTLRYQLELRAASVLDSIAEDDTSIKSALIAAELVVILDGTSATRLRAQKLANAGAQRALERARETQGLQQLLYWRIAQRLGAAVDERQLAALFTQVELSFGLQIDLAEVESPSSDCAPFVDAARRFFGDTKGTSAVPARATLRLSRCVHLDQRSESRRVFTYRDYQADGEVGAEVAYRPIHASTRQRVQLRQMESSVFGSFSVDLDGSVLDFPIQQQKAVVEREYWSPEKFEVFTSLTIDELAANSAAEFFRDVVHQLETRDHAARRATRLNEAVQSEGIDIDGASFLQGTAVHITPVSPPELPARDWDVDEYVPVEVVLDRRGASLYVGDGVDVYARVEGSPLRDAAVATTAGLTFRTTVVTLALEGRTLGLGSDASGFGASFHIPLLDLEADGLLLTIGGAWDHQRAASGEGNYMLAVPLTAVLPIGSRIALEGRIDLNLLTLDLLFDGDDLDKHFYSRATLRAVVDVHRRLLLSGFVRHHLGIGGREPIHGGVELGVRL